MIFELLDFDSNHESVFDPFGGSREPHVQNCVIGFKTLYFRSEILAVLKTRIQQITIIVYTVRIGDILLFPEPVQHQI